jgi:hypothetical protein
MFLSLNLPDSEFDCLLIRRQQHSSKSDQIAAGGAPVTRPSSLRRDPTQTPRVMDGDGEMRDAMRGLEEMARVIRDADNSKGPHLELQEFSGEEEWEEFMILPGDEVGVTLTLRLPVKSQEEKCGHMRRHYDKLVNTDTLSREQDYTYQSCAVPDKTPSRGDTYFKKRKSPSCKRRDRNRRRGCGRRKGSPTLRPLVRDAGEPGHPMLCEACANGDAGEPGDPLLCEACANLIMVLDSLHMDCVEDPMGD